jgi:hypothetical protein
MNIRLVIAKDWPNGDFDNDDPDTDHLIHQYVNDNANNINKLEEVGLDVEDFTVPDTLDKQLVLDICSGKTFGVCFNYSTDFYSDYYQNWIFVEKNGTYSNLH